MAQADTPSMKSECARKSDDMRIRLTKVSDHRHTLEVEQAVEKVPSRGTARFGGVPTELVHRRARGLSTRAAAPARGSVEGDALRCPDGAQLDQDRGASLRSNGPPPCS